MATQIFINLSVKDLQKSIGFFTHLGFNFNPQFTDETATCMIISENIYVMLLIESRFQEFTKKPVSDAFRPCGLMSITSLNRCMNFWKNCPMLLPRVVVLPSSHFIREKTGLLKSLSNTFFVKVFIVK